MEEWRPVEHAPRAKLPKFEEHESFWTDVRDALSAHEPKVKSFPRRRERLSAEQKAAIAEEERLEAELAKRNDETILAEIERRIVQMSSSGIGATPWERAERLKRARSPEGRIASYDAILEQRRGRHQVYAR